MAGRRKTRSRRIGPRLPSGHFASWGKKKSKSKKRRSAKTGRRVTSKTGRVYVRTAGGRFKQVGSRIGSRTHRKGKRKAAKRGRSRRARR